ncbi:hypothetical protein OSH04_02120 [Alcaligenes sp. A-TC2]|uniref:hypothetical protein n=1 Tax=Alcaligenes nematophilus TaxID=2994643 RepID=UPI0022546A26|nr:hypothetical protein [Alcaligenes nematophilus]MCX5470505.1 hypothetical protein [Alcaligenes nematophilus]
MRILALGFSAGAVGGFLGIAVTSWLADGHKVLGASWWEFMTAFGTVGATLFAGYSVRQSRMIATESARRAKASVLEPKRAGYYALLTDCKATYAAMTGVMNSTNFDQSARDQCSSYHWTRLCNPVAFQVPVVEVGEWAGLDEKSADLIAQVGALINEAKTGVSRLLPLEIHASADSAIDVMNKIDSAVYKASLAINSLYPDSIHELGIKQARNDFIRKLEDFKKRYS